ncbi:hypothetical protein [Saccharopolyspora antimicrobica]|nr:hypothetical protein [Saccharopolyspora antimicrobica]
MVLAGVVVAFAGAATTLYVEFIILSAARHSNFSLREFWEPGRQVLAALPFVALAVLALGIPLGLIADKIARRFFGHHWASAGVFFICGITAGAIMCGIFGLDLTFGVAAAVAAPLAQAGAYRLARNRTILTSLTLICIALTCTTLAIWAFSIA